MSKVLFYVISDPKIYEEFKLVAGDLFPSNTFAFLGETFAEKWWSDGWKRDLLPTSRLLLKWVQMNEFSSNVVIPAINKSNPDYRAVVVCGYGRGAYHYAIRHEFCCETLAIHELLVKMRLELQNGKKPDSYFAEHPDEECLRKADKAYFEEGKGQKMTYFRSKSVSGQVDEICTYVAREMKIKIPLREVAA